VAGMHGTFSGPHDCNKSKIKQTFVLL